MNSRTMGKRFNCREY